MGLFILIGLVYISRLFYLQLINNSYKFSAENIVLRSVTQYPARGIIYDRNNNLLVYNDAAYDLMVIPRQAKNIDTLKLCMLAGITKSEYIEKMRAAKRYSYYKPSVFVKQISKADYGRLTEEFTIFRVFMLRHVLYVNILYPLRVIYLEALEKLIAGIWKKIIFMI